MVNNAEALLEGSLIRRQFQIAVREVLRGQALQILVVQALVQLLLVLVFVYQIYR